MKKQMALTAIVLGTFVCLFGTASKAMADTFTLDSVTQVATHQVQGKGTWATNGTLVSITMHVNDPKNNNVSTTAGITVMQTWSSISTAPGGLTPGLQYTVYAVMKTTNNGLNTETTSTPLAITIAAKP